MKPTDIKSIRDLEQPGEPGEQAQPFGGAEFFEVSLDNLCIVGFDGCFKRVNASWTKTLGWTQEELMARPVADFVHPDDRDEMSATRARLRAGLLLRDFVNRYRCKDGTYRSFEWSVQADVERELYLGAARDVTEQHEARRALRDLTESLTTTLNSIADGVIATDVSGAVARMNPVAEKLTGWAFSDARGLPLDQVFHIVYADTRLTAAPPVERTLREGIAVEILKHTLLLARDGTELPIASSCAAMRDADGNTSGVVLVFRDMTAEKTAKEANDQLQRQLLVVDRMASVGTLAAGVAHEINNPLASVTANLDLLIEATQALGPGTLSEEMAEIAREARQGTERIRKIVRALDTFSRAEEERRRLIDVKALLELSIDLAFNEIRHRARLVRDYGELPRVEADEARLGQVFINLLVNAAQAVPEGDTEANEIRVVTSTDATGRAVVEIWDSGPGIPDSVIGRVFEPFFTTKPVGVGTGLGLSICHNIVAALGGQLTASNRPGHGAIFRVTLPAASAAAHAEPPAAAQEKTSTVRRAAVLIVDDERAVGLALSRTLRDHDVTVVTTGKEALGILLAGTTFDVILSDLMMPEMSGMDLYEELVRCCPQAAERTVFITGGAFTPTAQAFLDRVPNQRLYKPFDLAAVRQLVKERAK